MSVVITLTSIPPRFSHLPAKLDSLLRQQVRPAAIELYVPRRYRRFGTQAPTLPRLPRGVEVIRVDEDLGPATKVLYAARRYRHEDVDLLLCDDDRHEDPHWLRRFTEARAERPRDILCEQGWTVDEAFGLPRLSPSLPRARMHAHRGRDLRYRLQRLLSLRLRAVPRQIWAQSGYVDVFCGYEGAMLRPSMLHADAWQIPEEAWLVEDVWLSGMAALAGTGVWLNAVRKPFRRDARADGVAALKHLQHQGRDQQACNRRCVDLLRQRYGLWA